MARSLPVDVAELVLQYLRALAWPIVVGAALYYLRQPLRDLVRQLRKASFGGAEVAFGAAEEESLDAELKESAPVLGAAKHVDVEPSAGQEPQAPPEPGDADPDGDASPPDDQGHTESDLTVRLAREAMEDLVLRAAEWGHARGVAGGEISGTRIEWTGDTPRLVTSSVDSRRRLRAADAAREAERVGKLRAQELDLHTRIKAAQEMGLTEKERVLKKDLARVHKELRSRGMNP
jgi:hypothetical protein